jgi:putative Mg2+ transporter-C (MgtC) family protein
METVNEFRSILPIFLLRGGFAIVCGALIGIERERRGKSAGFRTNILICLGSALYMMVSEFLLTRHAPNMLDPTRIAAQVVTGIGFLGAGTIIQSGGTVTGLTTAASIWVVAAIGILVGAGFPLLGLIGTMLVLITLVLLPRVESFFLGACRYETYRVTFDISQVGSRPELATILADFDVDFTKLTMEQTNEQTHHIDIRVCEKHPVHYRQLLDLWRASGVVSVTKQS